MALVKGTNCGFCSATPSADPNEGSGAVDGYPIAFRDTCPAGSNKVKEIGFYQSNPTNGAADYEVGIYSHDAVNDRPNALVESASTGQATTASTVGWYKYTGLDIDLVEAETRWIGVAVAAVDDANSMDLIASAGDKYDYSVGDTLPSSWGTSSGSKERLISIYAKYEAASGMPIPLVMLQMDQFNGGSIL